MNIQPSDQNGQTLSDDQELAKVLAGINGDSSADEAVEEQEQAVPTLPPLPTDGTMPDPLAPQADQPQQAQTAAEPAAEAAAEPAAVEAPAEMPPMPPLPPLESSPAPIAAPSGDSELESIKQEALGELRPLVDKLNVTPEEKFDTYLLLLRSTDDKELIAPAHEAAKAITDESRKAQALFEIIKEIDFLNQSQPPQS